MKPSLVPFPRSLFTPKSYLCPSHLLPPTWKCCQSYLHRKIWQVFFLLKEEPEKIIRVNPYSSFRTTHSWKQNKVSEYTATHCKRQATLFSRQTRPYTCPSPTLCRSWLPFLTAPCLIQQLDEAAGRRKKESPVSNLPLILPRAYPSSSYYQSLAQMERNGKK